MDNQFLKTHQTTWAAQFCISLILTLALAAPCGMLAQPQSGSPRHRESFNTGWRFSKGDPEAARLDYSILKPWLLDRSADLTEPRRPSQEGNPGEDVSYVQPLFDDSGWRRLNLPHDWGIEGPFKQEYPGETGKLAWWGIGWYRKHFRVAPEPNNQRVFLEVDGAMAYAAVWLNGRFVGGWPYGYSSWSLDLTPFIQRDAENVIAIRLENPQDSSRWYPGGGIYRNLWLVTTTPVHVAHWGTFVTTPKIQERSASIEVQLTLENQGASKASSDVSVDIFEADQEGHAVGKSLATVQKSGVSVPADGRAMAAVTCEVSRPRLWSVQQPNRYVAIATVRSSGAVMDRYETPFGIRQIRFTPDKGFLLNGVRLPLNGVCDHHDLGALGAAVNTRALERQIELLKEMGCNAIRTSHNPPAPELLELCDRLGMVVMDEAFDCWVRGKKSNDYHLLFPEWHEKDLRALVRRDRNHPCVILWSIGNEIAEQGYPAGHHLAGELAAIVRAEDSTRPVTAGCNDARAGFNGFQKEVDVFGYNYKPTEYGKVREANPNLPLFGSETASCVSSRGEYFFPVSNDKGQGRADFQVSSYDLYAPPWATCPDTEFRGQDEFPFSAGEFVWTGFDYLGEPTPYNGDASNLLNFTDPAEKARLQRQLDELGTIRVPSRSSYFGIIDLAGFKKDRFYIYQARWRPDYPMVHILPHWNWPERVGQVTPVHAYTSGDEAELFLNGKSLGRKMRGAHEYRLRWDEVVYQPGEVRVVAYKHNRRWAEEVIRTTGPASQILLKADRASLRADGTDLAFVTVTVADAKRLQVPRSKNRLSFALNGPGEIVGLDNGDASSFESFRGAEHEAFNGLCLVIIRSTGQPGRVTLRASSPGLAGRELQLQTRSTPPPPQ